MKKKILIIAILLVVITIAVFILGKGGKRTDVFLDRFCVAEDGKMLKINVGISSSMGYIKDLEVKQEGDSQYITFYSTIGVNNKLGAKDEFEIELNSSCQKIYFYSGDNDFQLVLQKNSQGQWNLNEKENKDISSEINIVTSLEDKISDNTAWCGTFNLIWNDLKNDLAKQDITFQNQTEIVNHLNKGTFNTSQLSEESYYKTYGTPSLELKREIETAIQEKFHETSDILDDFDWNNHDEKDYFLYAMLKKEFTFPKIFTELENGKFGEYENVKYFGIDETSEKEVRNQVEVLYYHSKENFAIKLFTQSNDEIIIARGNEKNTFGDVYQEIKEKSENYDGDFNFASNDTLKIPNITFNLKEQIHEVENKPFYFSNGEEYKIEKALQTIQFELDKKGGKIKSEAGMMVEKMAVMMPQEPREFLVEDTFTIFLLEQDKDLPYFAAQITDISKFQEDTQKENPYFYGTIIESNKNSIIVEPNEEEEIRKSADKISIKLDEDSDYLYEIGTNVKITYNGMIMETYPAQVEVIDIELKSTDDFAINFIDKSYESREKVRTILNKTETDKYDYNIYAYMGEVKILVNKKEITLRDALLENRITMDEIIAKANQDVEAGKIKGDMYKDGGSMIYQYHTYTIIKVHNLDGNRDVYIGTTNMTLNDLKI